MAERDLHSKIPYINGSRQCNLH